MSAFSVPRPDGVTYRANDPRLLNWVQATASFGFIEAYSRYVNTLSRDEQSQAYAEGAAASQLYGTTGAPQSTSEWQSLLRETYPTLESSVIIFEFLEIMRSADVMPSVMRPIQRLLIRAAVDLIPPDLRLKLHLDKDGLPSAQRLMVRAVGKLADKVPIKGAPPAQASVRMGLDPSFLYRG